MPPLAPPGSAPAYKYNVNHSYSASFRHRREARKNELICLTDLRERKGADGVKPEVAPKVP